MSRSCLRLPKVLLALAAASCAVSACSRPVMLGAAGLTVAALALDPEAPAASTVPDEGPFFYRGGRTGTDAYAGPFDVILNKGYATTQWVLQEGDRRLIFENEHGWSGVWASVTSPGEAARNSGGWGQLLKYQVVPFATSDWQSWGWASNFTGHLLEGGVAHRRLTEWFDAQGAPVPALLSGLTVMGASAVNEAYELATRSEPDGSAMIDLLVFDLGGVLLFQSDLVARFAAKRLGAAIWPTQASITAPDGRLINNGHHLILRVPLRFSDRTFLFLKTGLGIQGGLSFRRSDGSHLSIALGGESRSQYIDPVTNQEKADFGWAAGVWWDRENTLLASVLVDQLSSRFLAVNVYPGLLRFADGQFGLWLTLDHQRRPYVGFTGRKSMGLGLGWGF